MRTPAPQPKLRAGRSRTARRLRRMKEVAKSIQSIPRGRLTVDAANAALSHYMRGDSNYFTPARDAIIDATVNSETL